MYSIWMVLAVPIMVDSDMLECQFLLSSLTGSE